MDTILVVVFMRLVHPWKDILFGQMKETEEVHPIESQDIQDTQSQIQVRFFLFIETGKHNYRVFQLDMIHFEVPDGQLKLTS